jgi:hypothetical protein
MFVTYVKARNPTLLEYLSKWNINMYLIEMDNPW